MHRHGGLTATPDGDWVLAVREVHRPGEVAAVRSVVALWVRGPGCHEHTLLDGPGFFGTPCVDPAGQRMAVVVWDRPDMPWDASSLLVASLERGARTPTAPGGLHIAAPAWSVAGGPDESVGQPAWTRDGRVALRLGPARLVAAVPALRMAGDR